MVHNIIFDWSGTLVDDLPAVLAATNEVFRRAGLEEFSLERFRAEFCLPFKKFYDRFTPHIPLNQLEEWFHSAFRQAQDSVVALPHAREFLISCRNRNIRCFLLSTVHPRHFAQQAATTGFGDFFERAYLGVLDKQVKLPELLRENALDPSETLFVGDMQHDIDAGNHSRVFTCAVLTGYTGLEHLRASKPDRIVEHLGELSQILHDQSWEMQLPAGTLNSARSHPVVTVGALVFNEDQQVLMLRTHKWSNLWGIPGGKVRFGESCIDALRREVKEETNLDVTQIEFVLVQDCIHSTEFYRDAHFVLLNYRCQAQPGGTTQLNDEAQEFRWLTPPEALKLPLNQPTRVLLLAAG